MKSVNVLYQTDDNYAFMAGVSIASLVSNASDSISYNIYYLDGGLSDDSKEKMNSIIEGHEKNIKLTFLDAQFCIDTVKSWKVPDHRGSFVTYYKLLLNHYFEGTDIDTIIHIGADTIITGDLSGLCDFDFKGKPFAMNPYGYNFFERHIPKDCNYCIAEMIYFNLPIWRQMRCEERLRAHIEQIGEIYGGKDQGLLNVEFKGEFGYLPLEYNIYGITTAFSQKHQRAFISKNAATDDEVVKAYKKPEIIHIPRTFLYRPNEENNYDPNNELWWKYCQKSPWKDMKPMKQLEELGVIEKIMRFLWIYGPKSLKECIYIYSRKLNGKINAIKYPPRPEGMQKAKLD